MCGFVGYSLTPGAAVGFGCLDDAVDAIMHRGPDESGRAFSEDNRIGLGHARLSIIDLSETGSQPMSCGTGRHVLVFNGELYDYKALREKLKTRGVRFRGGSDTEVLLNALVLDGYEALSGLNGMFAFALWDRETGEVTVVRDQSGIKPLYLSCDERGVFFASEVRALLRLGVRPDPVDPVETARYVQNLWNQAGKLPSPNLRTLEPGCAITIRDGLIARKWRWHSPPTLSPQPNRRSQSATEQELVKLLGQAVERQLVADVPVGAFLSGGLDSSALVALARPHVRDLACFTIEVQGGQEAGATDDLPYARRVAEYLGVTLHTVKVDESRIAQDLEMMVVKLEEPIADPACLNTYYICRHAREHGMKVLLSGAGGDDLFTGYRRHQAAQIDSYVASLPRPARKVLGALGAWLGTAGANGRRLNKLLEGSDMEPEERLINYFRWTKPAVVQSLFAPEFRAAVRDADLDAPMRAHLRSMDEAANPIERLLSLEQRFFLAEHNLIYSDKMSMAASVEVRVPFLDPDVIRFATTIPSCMKQRRMTGKWIFKKAMEPYLPKDVIYRPKVGFGVPLRRWISGRLSDLADELLSENTIRRRGLFDHNAVDSLRRISDAGKIDESYTLFCLMCIEIWCRNFLDTSASRL